LNVLDDCDFPRGLLLTHFYKAHEEIYSLIFFFPVLGMCARQRWTTDLAQPPGSDFEEKTSTAKGRDVYLVFSKKEKTHFHSMVFFAAISTINSARTKSQTTRSFP
jgi:hypothetical protein